MSRRATALPASASDASRNSSSFDLLDQGVRRWVEREGWESLRDAQERAIPAVIEADRDVILAAPTAAGKTEAAFLPICSNIAALPVPDGLAVLYVSPLKALINDQQRRLEPLCGSAGIKVASWHGDIDAGRKRRIRERPEGVLLITPESVEALFVRQGTSVGRMFGALRFVVIDELHSFIGTERGKQLQSLLHRIELVARHRIPRVGLSATLGDLEAAGRFLRPGGADPVEVIESKEDGRELLVQLRGYLNTDPSMNVNHPEEEATTGVEDLAAGDHLEIASDLYRHLRGHDNLVFANSRSTVEQYADLLRRHCESNHRPNEFWAHHGNLSKELREDVERRLKETGCPTTAVCTSTLELGIDVGSVSTVGQIDAPFSVAATRQRLGRCGRRPGDPSVLRLYVSEEQLDPGAPLRDDLREGLIQTVAVVEALIDGWFEPPIDDALHLSTLVQQVLSTIAQCGGAKAGEMWISLCATGPFLCSEATFEAVLLSLASHDVIQQVGDGDLILAPEGEQIVGHYSFYSAFTTPVEYRLLADGQEIGSLPIETNPREDSHLIFGGRRWLVLTVDHERRVISVEPSAAGRVPGFIGGGGSIHDGIRTRMFEIYENDSQPIYLDRSALQLLVQGRSAFHQMGLDRHRIIESGDLTRFFPWAGDRAMLTLALGIGSHGLRASVAGLTIEVQGTSRADLEDILRTVFTDSVPDPIRLAAAVGGLELEKHHRLLDEPLLVEDFAAGHIDIEGARRAVEQMFAA
jgi:ATP-dependent helicase Lhr and Lhr-like helicase